MTQTFTLYKLIVLYMLEKVDFPLTTSQISEFILDKGYTTYFKLQETLSEMVEIRAAPGRHHAQPYAVPPDGKWSGDNPVLQRIRSQPQYRTILMSF